MQDDSVREVRLAMPLSASLRVHRATRADEDESDAILLPRCRTW